MIEVPVIDAHHHFADLDLGYPWLAASAPTDRYHGDDRALRTNYLRDDYRVDVDTVPVVASVHIENGAADPLAEALWLGEMIAEGSGIPAAHVARADLSSDDAPILLERLAAMGHVHGIRHILNWHPDPRYSHTDRPGISSEPRWRSNFARLADLGLSFDLQVFAEQLPEAAALASAHPETLIVLDHAGMPIRRDPQYISEWRRGLRMMASAPNVTVKLSAFGTTDHAWTYESIEPLVSATIDTFGPERCMFGSNFPVDRLYSSFTELYSTFDRLTSTYSKEDRAAMFGATAARVYRLDTCWPAA